MSLSSRLDLASLSAYPSSDRRRRLRLALVRSSLRIGAEESSTVISEEVTEELYSLGYDDNDISRMTPDIAQDVIDGGVTKEQREQAAQKREEAFDEVENRVLQDLEAIKKRLDLARKRLEGAESQVDKLDSLLAETEEKREQEEDLEAQEKLRQKSEWIQDHIDRAEQAEEIIRREISALEKLVSSITNTEESLINELQEANDASLLTPGTEDDELVQSLMKDKLATLDEISSLRKELLAAQKELDNKMSVLLKAHRDLSKLLDLKPTKAEVNTLRDVIRTRQEEVDLAEKKQKQIVSKILYLEDKLRDISTEQRLQELDEAIGESTTDQEELNDFALLKERSKEQIQQEDPGKDIAKKPLKYNQKAEEILSFVDELSKNYGDFILSFLAPDIPSDPQVENFIRSANGVILKRSEEAKKLASTYSRNPMHRSSILLVPSLYEFLASTMDGVVSTEDMKQAVARLAEAERTAEAFSSAGFVREAIEIKELAQKALQWGRQGVDKSLKFLSFVHTKGLQLADKVEKLVEQTDEFLDKKRFEKEDTGSRRDPKAELRQQQQTLQQLIEAEREVARHLEVAKSLQERLSSSGDESSLRQLRDTISKLQDQLSVLGERKNVLENGLSSHPSPGAMRGQEGKATRPKTDYEQSVRLMSLHMPKLTSLLQVGIPDDSSLEKELLRQSDRISSAVRKMIQESMKARKKYPNLPPTIQAYGHMFLAIDDALNKAIRS